MIAPEMPSETQTTTTSTIVIVPVQKAFSLFTRRSLPTDHPRIQAKSDAKDAAIIADQARMRRDLQPLRPGDEITVELRILTERLTGCALSCWSTFRLLSGRLTTVNIKRH